MYRCLSARRLFLRKKIGQTRKSIFRGGRRPSTTTTTRAPGPPRRGRRRAAPERSAQAASGPVPCVAIASAHPVPRPVRAGTASELAAPRQQAHTAGRGALATGDADTGCNVPRMTDWRCVTLDNIDRASATRTILPTVAHHQSVIRTIASCHRDTPRSEERVSILREVIVRW